MQFLLSALILSSIGGQLLRIPYLQGTGILVTDFILGLIILLWFVQLITKQVKIKWNFVNNTLILFWLLMLFSLFLNTYNLPNSDILMSFFYYLRLIAYSALFLIAQNIPKEKLSFFFNLIIFSALYLAILGFLQLKFFPDFEVLRMQEKGWDPHIGRLLSTWYDPNFLGGFFAFVLSLLGGVLVNEYNRTKNLFNVLKNKQNLFYLISFVFIGLALVLTYSRSAYLAFLVGMFLLGIIASRKMLIIFFVSVILLFSFSERLQTRVIDAYNSAQALFSQNNVNTLDASARFRYQSWQDGLNLFNEKPILGHGYNTLRYLQAKRGYTEWKSHAAGGIDSSLLTILVTTGISGLILYLTFFSSIVLQLFQKKKKSPLLKQGLSLGLICGIPALFIHSFFVNSLLFPLIMLYLWFLSGLIMQTKN